MTRKRSHTLSHILLGFILLIALASPMVASAAQQVNTNTLTQDDIEFIFGPEANIAAFKQLSPQEMAETDGTWTFWALRQAFYSGALRLWGIARRLGGYWPTRVPGRDGIWQIGSNLRFRYMHHNAHHRFPLVGKQPHRQITYWRRNPETGKWIKGQEKHIRIPTPGNPPPPRN